MELQDAHAPGERIGQPRNEQHVGGAGEDEASRSPALINGSLERCEDLRDPLHLVEGDLRRKRADEADRVVPRGTGDGLVVERHVPVPARLADGPRQGRLAALSRAVDQDSRGIGKRLAESRREVAGIGSRRAGHARRIGSRAAECKFARRLNASFGVG